MYEMILCMIKATVLIILLLTIVLISSILFIHKLSNKLPFLFAIWEALLLLLVILFSIEYSWWGMLDENESTDFRIEQQLYLPFYFGSLGGYSLILIKSLKHFKELRTHSFVRFKFTFIGAVAGVAAVNLLNPTGTVSQLIILALIAGLSGVSYLSRNALVDLKLEDDIIETLRIEQQKKIDEYHQETSDLRQAELDKKQGFLTKSIVEQPLDTKLQEAQKNLKKIKSNLKTNHE